jgi:hypothetical protein
MCFLRPWSVPRRYGTARRASCLLLWPVASSATQRRLARPGMAASPFREMTVPGRFFSPSVQPSSPIVGSPGRHLANVLGLFVGRLDRAVATSTYGKVVGIVPLAHHRFPAPPRRETGRSPAVLDGLLLGRSRHSPSFHVQFDNALATGTTGRV